MNGRVNSDLQGVASAFGGLVGSYAGEVTGAAVGGMLGGAIGGAPGATFGAKMGKEAGFVAGSAVGAYLGAIGYAGEQVYSQRVDQNISKYGIDLDGAVSQCFSGDVKIELMDGKKNIRDISPGDFVLSFSENKALTSRLTAGRVVRVFRSITSEWIVFPDGTAVTPGHKFLNEKGAFERIDYILARAGMIVTISGELKLAVAERVSYSEQTRDLYEEDENFVYASSGSGALQPEIKKGWRTYNFEVESLHTYIADGYRVHNDSVGDYNGLANALANAEAIGDERTAALARAALAEHFGPSVVGLAEEGFVAARPGEVTSTFGTVNAAFQTQNPFSIVSAIGTVIGDIATTEDPDLQNSAINSLVGTVTGNLFGQITQTPDLAPSPITDDYTGARFGEEVGPQVGPDQTAPDGVASPEHAPGFGPDTTGPDGTPGPSPDADTSSSASPDTNSGNGNSGGNNGISGPDTSTSSPSTLR